jgi:hypothetical protein
MGAHVIVVTALLSSTALLQGWCLSPARVAFVFELGGPHPGSSFFTLPFGAIKRSN